jgi:hypothetical protein
MWEDGAGDRASYPMGLQLRPFFHLQREVPLRGETGRQGFVKAKCQTR